MVVQIVVHTLFFPHQYSLSLANLSCAIAHPSNYAIHRAFSSLWALLPHAERILQAGRYLFVFSLLAQLEQNEPHQTETRVTRTGSPPDFADRIRPKKIRNLDSNPTPENTTPSKKLAQRGSGSLGT